MFPRVIRSSNRDNYQFALMFGRDFWFYTAMVVIAVAGAITTFFEANGQSLIYIGMAIVVAGLVLPMILLLAARPVIPWASATELTIYGNGKMEVSLRLFKRQLKKKKTMKLTYIEKRKEGYYLGTSFRRSVFMPFGSFGHADTEFFETLELMIKNGTYPEA